MLRSNSLDHVLISFLSPQHLNIEISLWQGKDITAETENVKSRLTFNKPLCYCNAKQATELAFLALWREMWVVGGVVGTLLCTSNQILMPTVACSLDLLGPPSPISACAVEGVSS